METDTDYRALLSTQLEHTLEEIALLEAAIRKEGVTIVGQRGSTIAHPALAALAKARATATALVKALDPNAESQSDKARRAAKARWARAKQPTERIFVPAAEANGGLL